MGFLLLGRFVGGLVGLTGTSTRCFGCLWMGRLLQSLSLALFEGRGHSGEGGCLASYSHKSQVVLPLHA